MVLGGWEEQVGPPPTKSVMANMWGGSSQNSEDCTTPTLEM